MDPTVEDLLLQRAAAGFPTPSRRRQGLPAPIRELHRRVLGHFAASGQAPLRAILSAWAAELGVGLQDALGRLVEADLVEANPATGHLAGAYPLVASPRGHQVRLPGGLTMEAYCAIDALGIPAMLDQDATITSRDPLIGAPITVEVHDGHARWEPAPVVVGYSTQTDGPTGDGGTAGQAACCRCPLIHFHASAATAQPALRPRRPGRSRDGATHRNPDTGRSPSCRPASPSRSSRSCGRVAHSSWRCCRGPSTPRSICPARSTSPSSSSTPPPPPGSTRAGRSSCTAGTGYET